VLTRCASEGHAAKAAESDDVERRQVARIGDRSSVTYQHASRRRRQLAQDASGAHVLVVDVSGGSSEKPHLLAEARCLVIQEKADARQAKQREYRSAHASAELERAREEGLRPERRRQQEPRDGGHGVALVLPAHLTIASHRQDPERGARQQHHGARAAAPKHQRERGEDPGDPAVHRSIGEVILGDAQDLIFQMEKPGVQHLRAVEVRVVSLELHESACGTRLAGE
jgi:hypothetical protein